MLLRLCHPRNTSRPFSHRFFRPSILRREFLFRFVMAPTRFKIKIPVGLSLKPSTSDSTPGSSSKEVSAENTPAKKVKTKGTESSKVESKKDKIISMNQKKSGDGQSDEATSSCRPKLVTKKNKLNPKMEEIDAVIDVEGMGAAGEGTSESPLEPGKNMLSKEMFRYVIQCCHLDISDGIRFPFDKYEPVSHPSRNGEMGIYVKQVTSGFLRLPLCSQAKELCYYYKIAPCQLTPNSWLIWHLFATLCHQRKVPYSLDLFRYLYVCQKNKEDRGIFTFKAKCQMEVKLDDAKDWKKSWFFIKEDDEELRRWSPWMEIIDDEKLLTPIATLEDQYRRLKSGAIIDHFRTVVNVNASLAAAGLFVHHDRPFSSPWADFQCAFEADQKDDNANRGEKRRRLISPEKKKSKNSKPPSNEAVEATRCVSSLKISKEEKMALLKERTKSIAPPITVEVTSSLNDELTEAIVRRVHEDDKVTEASSGTRCVANLIQSFEERLLAPMRQMEEFLQGGFVGLQSIESDLIKKEGLIATLKEKCDVLEADRERLEGTVKNLKQEMLESSQSLEMSRSEQAKLFRQLEMKKAEVREMEREMQKYRILQKVIRESRFVPHLSFDDQLNSLKDELSLMFDGDQGDFLRKVDWVFKRSLLMCEEIHAKDKELKALKLKLSSIKEESVNAFRESEEFGSLLESSRNEGVKEGFESFKNSEDVATVELLPRSIRQRYAASTGRTLASVEKGNNEPFLDETSATISANYEVGLLKTDVGDKDKTELVVKASGDGSEHVNSSVGNLPSLSITPVTAVLPSSPVVRPIVEDKDVDDSLSKYFAELAPIQKI